jgi:hypothetical protein
MKFHTHTNRESTKALNERRRRTRNATTKHDNHLNKHLADHECSNVLENCIPSTYYRTKHVIVLLMFAPISLSN